jgi:hypothetical protein
VLWHRIAYDWHMPVRWVKELLTSEDFTEVCAYLRREPRGYETENWRVGMLAATVANASGKYQRKLKPADFFPPKPKKLRLTKAQETRLRELRGNSKRRDQKRVDR